MDWLIDTSALSGAIPEVHLRKVRLLAPHTVLNEGPPPDFQIRVANRQFEATIATVELQIEYLWSMQLPHTINQLQFQTLVKFQVIDLIKLVNSQHKSQFLFHLTQKCFILLIPQDGLRISRPTSQLKASTAYTKPISLSQIMLPDFCEQLVYQ